MRFINLILSNLIGQFKLGMVEIYISGVHLRGGLPDERVVYKLYITPSSGKPHLSASSKEL